MIKCEDLSKRHILNKAVATLRALYKSLMDLWSGCEQFGEKGNWERRGGSFIKLAPANKEASQHMLLCISFQNLRLPE